MAKIQVKDFGDLVRDTNSKAIINTNKSEFHLYMARMKAREKQGDEIRSAVKEINNLKQELFEIKSMIKQICEKGK